jgi:hypothetical protein
VFAEFNKTVTLDTVVAWLTARGHRVTSQTDGRVEFARAGKDGDRQSFNVQMTDGVPVTYCFSTNAGLPVEQGLSPSQLRCFLENGACDKEAMRAFAQVLKKEMGWEDEGTKAAGDGGGGGGPAAGPGGPAKEDNSPEGVIRRFFVERYRPVFRDGNAIVTKDGETVSLTRALDSPTSDIIARLSVADDAPTYKGGGVNRNALPGHYRTWGKVAWGNLLTTLPDEDAGPVSEPAKVGVPATGPRRPAQGTDPGWLC